MRDSSGGEDSGLFTALKNVAAMLLESGKTRLLLLGNEIEEEKFRIVHLVLMAQGMFFCLCFGVALLIAFLTVLFWDSKAVVLGVFTGVFFVLGYVFYNLFKRATHRPERVFSATIAELQEDLRQLKEAARYEQSAK